MDPETVRLVSILFVVIIVALFSAYCMVSLLEPVGKKKQ
jgi:phage shock protein PspC (stress-responsive transcriptional regulator)